MKSYVKHFVDNVAPMLSAQHEQLFFLRQYGPFYFWLHVLTALLLCLLLWMKIAVAGAGIVVWFLAVALLAVGSWLVQSQLKKGKLIREQLVRYRLITILLCAVWGMSGIFLFSDDPLVQVIHLCLLLVITLSVWPVSIISPVEFYLQLALLLMPVTLMLALQENLQTNLLCFVVLAFVATAVLMTQFFSQILSHLFTKEKSLLEQIPVNPTTKLMSSQHFDQAFKKEWRRSAREQQPLSLIMVEINNFREMECMLDAQTSRKYLSETARCLKSVAKRSADTLAHHDNAHFIALLPGAKLGDAHAIAERLQLKVEAAKLPNPLSNSLDENDVITVSVGVSSCVPVMNANNSQWAAMSYPAGLLGDAERALRAGNEEKKASAASIPLSAKSHPPQPPSPYSQSLLPSHSPT